MAEAAPMDPESPAAKLEFAGALIDPMTMLTAGIEWINDHLQPGDVFDSEKLEAWARAAGFNRPEEG